MNGKSKARALALLLGVLLLGGVAGAAVDRLILRTPSNAASEGRRSSDRDRRESYLDWLAAELALTEQQRHQVGLIVERHREEMSRLWRDARPRYEELQAGLRAEIGQLLSEEQQRAYEALLERERERHSRRRGRR